MAKKVLIFQELLTQLPTIKEALTKWGVEIITVAGGKDVLVRLSEKPAAILMDIAMPQMSGIECCRQIKEGEITPEVKIILVSSVASSSVEERAVNAGCDLFTFIGDAPPKIFEFLRVALQQTDTEPAQEQPEEQASAAPAEEDSEFRSSPRVDVSGTMVYEIAGTRKPGELINLSSNGALFALEAPLPNDTQMTLHFHDYGGQELEVAAVSVRTVTLKERKKGMQYACGGKFLNPPPAATSKIERFITSKNQEEALAAQLSPEYVQSILNAEPGILTEYLAGNQRDVTLHFLNEVSEYERNSFSLQDPRAEVVRRMILLRVQCEVLRAFAIRAEANPQVLGAFFFKQLSGLLSRADAIESEAEAQVKEAVAKEDEVSRAGLNESSNRLHESKMSLLFKVDDRLSAHGLGAEAAAVFEQVKKRVDGLRTRHESAAGVAKYSRKTAPLPPSKQESEKKKGPGKSIFKQGWFITMSSIAVIVIGFVWVPYFLFSRVSSGALMIPLEFERATQDEDSGLVIHSTRAAWKQLSQITREQVFQTLEEYLYKHKLPQMKIVDENNKTMAALSSTVSGNQRFYSRRVFY